MNKILFNFIIQGWVSDSVTQQIHPQSPQDNGSEMSGYAALTRPTGLRKLNGLMLVLGAGDQSLVQKILLVEALGLGGEANR